MCIFKNILQVLSWVWFQYLCVEYFRYNQSHAYRIHVFDSSGNPALPTLKSFGSLRADKFPNGILRLKGKCQPKLCLSGLKEC